VLRPTVQAAFTLKECGKLYGNVELSGLVDALSEQTRASSDCDLKQAGSMLTPQAHVLDALFNSLTRIAMNAEHLETVDRYLKLALRAQSQCRATWEAISAIQNPPLVSYVAQANIAGNQQVNNASAEPEVTSRAHEKTNLKNKLLEKNDDERMDFGETSSPGQAHPAMATVEEIDRPEDLDGQGRSIS